jgi:hypothetical protein
VAGTVDEKGKAEKSSGHIALFGEYGKFEFKSRYFQITKNALVSHGTFAIPSYNKSENPR